ncbi:aminotransferase class V-fold PLP-dependent enzyme [Candidatus Saccharibacteria bacterium]|nr:aminotransferase class V-fold PLP-dependent enzyme [Candidatus Saccharibacteria bacterium]
MSEKQRGEVYLDNAATAKKHPNAINAEAHFYREINANPLRGLYKKSVQAKTGVDEARKAVLELVKADKSYTVIFSRGATEALNMVANGLIKDTDGFGVITRGAKIVVDIESHHSNILPWKQRYKEIIIAKNMDARELFAADVVSLTGVSNVTGKCFLKRIETVRRTCPKAILGVDGAQMVGHVPFNITRLGVDFMAFSGHKFGAPMGIGGLIIKKELAEKLRPLNYGGGAVDAVSEDGEPIFAEIPERLEAGTMPVGAIFGLKSAVKVAKERIEDLGAIDRFDETTTGRFIREAVDDLRKIKGVKVLAANNLIITFQVKGVHPHDVAQVLAEDNVMVRAGWLCAEPFLRYKGWGPVIRASFMEDSDSFYIKALVDAVSKVRAKMGLEDNKKRKNVRRNSNRS